MASVHREIVVKAALETVWDALRDVGALHTRLVPGFVTSTVLEDDGRARRVTFANGQTVREQIVDIDDSAHRVAWSASGGRLSHHHASAQLFPEGSGTRFVWVADFLPHEAAPVIAQMIDAGMATIQRTFDAPR